MFQQKKGSYQRIYANRFDGSSWGTASLIDAVSGNDAENPQVACDGSGNAISVFPQGPFGSERIYYLEGGAVDTGLNYLGTVDRNGLQVQQAHLSRRPLRGYSPHPITRRIETV